MTAPAWDRASVRVVIGLCVAKVLAHLLVVNRYGYHGDELYFIECGRHLAFGYVDHPPLLPWLARVADELGGSLFVLRLPAIVAGAGTMLLTALTVREWRGGALAQLLALACLLFGPAHLRLAAMLNIPVIEVFLCTLTAYLVVRALSREERWTWIAAGGALGLAILAKHASLVWGAALAVGLLATPARRALATRWPWVGALLALALFAPNLWWQAQNDFATLEFMQGLRERLLVEGRAMFLAGQLIYFHPLAVPVWATGLVFAFKAEGRAMRPFGVLFLTMLVFLLVAGGKPYYLASAYPPVLAAGGVALERYFATRAVGRRVYLGALATTGLALGLLSLPLFPLRTVDAAAQALFGFAIPPMALTHDMHGMHGWEDHVREVARVQSGLAPDERARSTVLAGSYSQAGALNVLGGSSTPHAVSGHLNYYLWGPDKGRDDVLITYGLPYELVEPHYQSCTEAGHVVAPLARPQDTDLPVFVCRGPREPLAKWWPELRRFGHGPFAVPAPAARVEPVAQAE